MHNSYLLIFGDMSTNGDESRPGSAADSVHDEASNQSDSDSETKTTISAGSTRSKEATTDPSALLADDPFRTGESKLLFEAIDELRRCGAGQDLELPQVRKQAQLLLTIQYLLRK